MAPSQSDFQQMVRKGTCDYIVIFRRDLDRLGQLEKEVTIAWSDSSLKAAGVYKHPASFCQRYCQDVEAVIGFSDAQRVASGELRIK